MWISEYYVCGRGGVTGFNCFKIVLKIEFICAYWLVFAYCKREFVFGQPTFFYNIRSSRVVSTWISVNVSHVFQIIVLMLSSHLCHCLQSKVIFALHIVLYNICSVFQLIWVFGTWKNFDSCERNPMVYCDKQMKHTTMHFEYFHYWVSIIWNLNCCTLYFGLIRKSYNWSEA
jgi:hypothetical protein